MNATLLLFAWKYRYRHAPVTEHKQIQASGERREHLQGQAGELNKNKWLIETKNTYAFFLPFCPPLSFPHCCLPPSPSLPPLCSVALMNITQANQRCRGISLISHPSFPSPISPFSLLPPLFLWLPCLSLSLYPVSLSTFPSSPLHMWISFSLIMMIWGSASVAGPLKPSSSSSKPCLSSYCRQTARQPHKMASTLHTAF